MKRKRANRDGATTIFPGTMASSETKTPHQCGARADARNLLATLLFSRGTPMLTMGAELGKRSPAIITPMRRTTPSWIDWARADEELIETTAKIIALRKRHPALRDDPFSTARRMMARSSPTSNGCV
jgi:glycogen operon protein